MLRLQELLHECLASESDISSLVDEGNSLAKMASSSRISNGVQQLASRYHALVAEAKVRTEFNVLVQCL